MVGLACRIQDKASEQSEEWQHRSGGVPFIILGVIYFVKRHRHGEVQDQTVRRVKSRGYFVIFAIV